MTDFADLERQAVLDGHRANIQKIMEGSFARLSGKQATVFGIHADEGAAIDMAREVLDGMLKKIGQGDKNG